MKKSFKQRRRGTFRKYTRKDLMDRYNDQDLVSSLVARKEKDGLAWDHPDFPGALRVASCCATQSMLGTC
jgi:hypothetical protein